MSLTRLVAALSEIPDVVLEREREPGAGLSPRDLLDSHAAARALDATRVLPEVQRHPRQVEVAPPPPTVAVIAGAGIAALRAATSSPRGRHIDDEPFLVEVDVEHTGPFQTQQGTE